ncbi:MAG: pyridoxal-dependent decarboxylase, partial [Gemmatimonadota bacterium]|nr:pyridoxal-dependent decarboxylase [Gemmatimonadota bacterium]
MAFSSEVNVSVASQVALQERSLDPDGPEEWKAMRVLGHRMLDDMLDSLEQVRQRPVWRPMPGDTKAWFDAPAPVEGDGAERAYEDFRRHVQPYPTGNTHPRFWGWVLGSGTPLGMLSDMLAAGFNPNCWGNETGAAYVEGQVIAWLKALMRFPSDASGLLVTGCSMANLIGISVGRNVKSGMDLAGRGLVGLQQAPVLYCSTETHNSVDKAALLLGLGAAAVRKIPVNASYQIDIDALLAAIAEDRGAGLHPFAIVANAGTVNTGAIDDLNRIADIAATQDLWMHVDGAFGAMAALEPNAIDRVSGMERADSLAFDLHKWLYVPFDAACVLVRDAAAHRRAFSPPASYLAHETRGTGSGVHWFNELGME